MFPVRLLVGLLWLSDCSSVMAVWYGGGGGGGIVDDLLLKYGADPTPGSNDVKYVSNLT